MCKQGCGGLQIACLTSFKMSPVLCVVSLYLPMTAEVAVKFSAQLPELHNSLGHVPSACISSFTGQWTCSGGHKRGAQQDRAGGGGQGRERGGGREGWGCRERLFWDLEAWKIMDYEVKKCTHFQGSRERPWKMNLQGWVFCGPCSSDLPPESHLLRACSWLFCQHLQASQRSLKEPDPVRLFGHCQGFWLI